jgi:hypothetical protein
MCGVNKITSWLEVLKDKFTVGQVLKCVKQEQYSSKEIK